MTLNYETVTELKEKFWREPFDDESLDINEIDNQDIKDEELKAIISVNNQELSRIFNTKPFDLERARKLFVATVNLYVLAKKRGMLVHGTHFLLNKASVVGYDIDKLYNLITAGYSNSIFEPRRNRK